MVSVGTKLMGPQIKILILASKFIHAVVIINAGDKIMCAQL